MAVEFPMVMTEMVAFGGEVPTTDAFPVDGYSSRMNSLGAVPMMETPVDFVSIATTATTAPMVRRNQFAGVQDLPDDNLNGKF